MSFTTILKLPGSLRSPISDGPKLDYIGSTSAPDDRADGGTRKKRTMMMLIGCGILQFPVWGMAMTFGIWQDAYSRRELIAGSSTASGIIGTTMNGVMYLSMPFLSTALGSERWIPWRRAVAVAGICLSSASFLISSWSTQVWHLILLQGVLAAFGNAMLYTPTTLWVDEWFQDGNRATAYGVQFSAKSIVGTGGPFLMYSLLQHVGFRTTLRLWAAISLIIGLAGIAMIPLPPRSNPRRSRHVPWTFLKHRTFYIYALANTFFSSGYGLPQTYLSTYASQILHLPGAESSLTIAIFNAPGIISSTGFGVLSDRYRVSTSVNTLISALGSAFCVFFLWGLKSHTVPAFLIAFSIGYGFFASGYSATWGGWIKELEREAAEHNEAVNSGMLYGLLNGVRGIGYVAGGLSGVELFKVGAVMSNRKWSLGTNYGALILFTGVTSLLGGWSIAWRACGRSGR